MYLDLLKFVYFFFIGPGAIDLHGAAQSAQHQGQGDKKGIVQFLTATASEQLNPGRHI